MKERETVLRSMHDAGLAAWFGGSLMGAIGLNGAAAKADDPRERLTVASTGWRRWAPVNTAAIGAHLLGASGILASERNRVLGQRGVGTTSAVKTALTVAALGATAYSRQLGKQLEGAKSVPVAGVTEPLPDTPEPVRVVQRRERVAQWAVPALTGALIAVSALAGEQQKPRSIARGIAGRVRGVAEGLLPAR
ncbi:hypothetical protein Drose_12600 [Dactylosporangium roseum]|uniref:ABC-type Mn/Zn transport systems, ATPase component n=1 Tax=Dactylosporangium roseum TaxID=47989 RepID=A0ABY5ZDZ0_9ACTN|nr:hypothetical protein [Dactylosporangium roseum]UWZ38982.1 hypothetical protein Drose_12600 [Dactylosporangium roseum]